MASSARTSANHRSVCVISGGTAGNEVLDAFTSVFDACAFVLPVSDNGGSSSEIIRVLGGPSLGDIRSRLVRLIPDAGDKQGIKALFAHRLPSSEDVDHAAIKQEWLEIVEGSHPLWRDISPERREAIRAFCVHFEHAILRRAQRRFNYRSGSIGNFWLAGVQLFVRSLQSAIFLFSSVCGIPSQYSVIPAINTNSLVTIAAELEDGSRIVGQNEISHPSADSGAQIHHGSYTPASGHWTPVAQRSGASSRQGALLPSVMTASSSLAGASAEDFDTDHDDLSGVLARTEHDLSLENDVDEGETSWDTPRRDEPRVHPASPTGSPHASRASSAAGSSAKGAQSNILFSKTEEGWPPLPARIARIIYLNTYGLETFPSPASAYIKSLQESQYLVYSCGSLFTSLIPPLALSGIGNTIALSQTLKAKVLLLNGSFDRETEGLTAVDFIEAVTSHLNGSIRTSPQLAQSAGSSSSHLQPASFRRPNRFAPGDYVTHLIYLEKGSVPVDILKLQSMSIQCIAIQGDGEKDRFSGASLAEALRGVLDGA